MTIVPKTIKNPQLSNKKYSINFLGEKPFYWAERQESYFQTLALSC